MLAVKCSEGTFPCLTETGASPSERLHFGCFSGFGVLCNLENPFEMLDDYGFRPRKGFGKDGEPLGNPAGTEVSFGEPRFSAQENGFSRG